MKQVPDKDWVSLGSAVHLLAEPLGGVAAARAILVGRLRQGRLQARAASLIITFEATAEGVKRGMQPRPQELLTDDPERQLHIEPSLWSEPPDLKTAITWNWDAESVTRREATGLMKAQFDIARIKLIRAEVEALLPGPAGGKQDGRVNSGAKRSPHWNEWIAELVTLQYEDGIDSNLPYSKLIRQVAQRLINRGSSPLGDETVRPAVNAVLDRLKESDRQK